MHNRTCVLAKSQLQSSILWILSCHFTNLFRHFDNTFTKPFPSVPFRAHTLQNRRPTGDIAQNPPFALGQRQRKNFLPSYKKRNAGSPAFPFSTLSWRNLLPKNNLEAVPSECRPMQGRFRAMLLFKKESDENLMWNPHRFHWLRSLFNSASSKAARTSSVGFYLHRYHLSGVHPLFHQLRDQQTDLTDDDHTRQHNRHQNTCVQHCNLSLLIYSFGCFVHFAESQPRSYFETRSLFLANQSKSHTLSFTSTQIHTLLFSTNPRRCFSALSRFASSF